jgi:aspartyl-tRNA(Asn)/glutamyl-tRNA(Gln) amidotransferase subunit B
MGRKMFQQHIASQETADEILAAYPVRQISDDAPLREAVERVLAANPAALADVAAGKTQALGFLTGQVMKETRGQANATRVGELLREMVAAERAP